MEMTIQNEKTAVPGSKGSGGNFFEKVLQISPVKFKPPFLRYDSTNTRPSVAAIHPRTRGKRKKRRQTMKLTDLIISPLSLGKKPWLVDVVPAYEYKNGSRTDTITGYRYSVALPEKGLEKITVKIDGEKRMDAPDGYVEVRFDDLEVFLYWSKGDYHVGAAATGVHLVNPKP